MDITFGPAKDAANIAKHGVSLAAAADFEWDTALIAEDTRNAYNETRYIVSGLIANRLHVLVFVVRNNQVRAISLRKANKREVAKYDQA